MKTRIFLVDSHTLLRNTLRLFLECKGDNIEVVGEASTAASAIEGVLRLNPDIVLMEIDFPDADGIAVTAHLLRLLPHIKILAVTVHTEQTYLLPFIQAGGYGFINKSATDHELIKAIVKVQNNEIYLSESGVQILARCYQSIGIAKEAPTYAEKDVLITSMEKGKEAGIAIQADEEITPDILSEREKQVLRLLSHGYNYREIGERLFLSISTVETYKCRISEKLQMPKKTELIEYAMKHKIL
ncbi:MAG: response regulator [Desulfitobacterium sp.]